jgi:hypothetical protein
MSAAQPGRSFTDDPHVREVLEQERRAALAEARHAEWDREFHAPYRRLHARWVAACGGAADAMSAGQPSAEAAAALVEVVACVREAVRHRRAVLVWIDAADCGQFRAFDTAPYLFCWGRVIEWDTGDLISGILADQPVLRMAPEVGALLALLRTAAGRPDDLPEHLRFAAPRLPGLARLADWLRLLRDVLLPPPDARSVEEWVTGLALPPAADNLAVRVMAGNVGLLGMLDNKDRTIWRALLSRLAPPRPPAPPPAEPAPPVILMPPDGGPADDDPAIEAWADDSLTDTGEGYNPAIDTGEDNNPPAPPAPRRKSKPSPAAYVSIRALRRARELSVGAIVRHLKTPGGKQLAEEVDALLTANPTTHDGRKRSRRDVVRAALRGHYNPPPGG